MQARGATIDARVLGQNCLVGVKGQELSSWVKVKMKAMWVFQSAGIDLVGQAIPQELRWMFAAMVTIAYCVNEDMNLLTDLNTMVNRAPRR